MASKKIRLDSNSPYLNQRDPVTQTRFSPGDVVYDCGNGHIYSADTWEDFLGASCPQCSKGRAVKKQDSSESSRVPPSVPSASATTRRPASNSMIVPIVIAVVAIISIIAVIAIVGGGLAVAASNTPERIVETREVEVTRISASEEDDEEPEEVIIIVTSEQEPTDRPSPTRTPRPTNTARSPTAVPTYEEYFPLQNCNASRLRVGDRAYVSFGGGPNGIRSEPDTNLDNIIGYAQEGEYVDIIGGPLCNYGWVLWRVESDGGVEGWTPEGNGREYWLIPEGL